jgi:hypothetical protein
VVLLLFLISRRGFSPSSCGVWLAREPVLWMHLCPRQAVEGEGQGTVGASLGSVSLAGDGGGQHRCPLFSQRQNYLWWRCWNEWSPQSSEPFFLKVGVTSEFPLPTRSSLVFQRYFIKQFNSVWVSVVHYALP